MTQRATPTQTVASSVDPSVGPPTPDDRTRREVVIVDDDPSVLQGLLLMFQDAGYSTVGFDDPLDALMWVSDIEPTCVIVDLKLPGIEGLDLVAAFCALGRHCVILVSAYVDVSTAVEAMRLGVDDVLQKPVRNETMMVAVDRGLTVLRETPTQDVLTFTRRERQVAELMLAGQTTKQIALQLSLSPRTVEFFRTSLLRKTQSPNTAALASALTRIGFGPAKVA